MPFRYRLPDQVPLNFKGPVSNETGPFLWMEYRQPDRLPFRSRPLHPMPLPGCNGHPIPRLQFHYPVTLLKGSKNAEAAKLLSPAGACTVTDIDRAYIVDKGTIKYQGTIAQLEKDEAIKKQYLAV